jgi:hypothetical protein
VVRPIYPLGFWKEGDAHSRSTLAHRDPAVTKLIVEKGSPAMAMKPPLTTIARKTSQKVALHFIQIAADRTITEAELHAHLALVRQDVFAAEHADHCTRKAMAEIRGVETPWYLDKLDAACGFGGDAA